MLFAQLCERKFGGNPLAGGLKLLQIFVFPVPFLSFVLGSPPRVSPFSYIGVSPARLGLNAGVAYAARSGLFTSGGVPIWLLIGWSINTHLCVNL